MEIYPNKRGHLFNVNTWLHLMGVWNRAIPLHTYMYSFKLIVHVHVHACIVQCNVHVYTCINHKLKMACPNDIHVHVG